MGEEICVQDCLQIKIESEDFEEDIDKPMGQEPVADITIVKDELLECTPEINSIENEDNYDKITCEIQNYEMKTEIDDDNNQLLLERFAEECEIDQQNKYLNQFKKSMALYVSSLESTKQIPKRIKVKTKSKKKNRRKHQQTYLNPALHTDRKYPLRVLRQIEISILNNDPSKTETEKYNYVCNDCGQEFESEHELINHMKTHSTDSGTYECVLCDMTFKSCRTLYLHGVRHHRSYKYQCSLCGQIFEDMDSAADHVTCEHPIVKQEYKCTNCDKSFVYLKSLTTHQEKHKEVTEYPEVIEDRTMRKCRMTSSTTNDSSVKCLECDKVLSSEGALNRHIENVHTFKGRKYQCDYCRKNFVNKRTVASHIAKSHNDASAERHACRCGRVFHVYQAFKAHEARAHKNLQIFKCGTCGKPFPTGPLLRRHERIHTDIQFPCPQCDLKFRTPDYVKIHYKIKHLNMTRAEIRASSKINAMRLLRGGHACHCGSVFLTLARLKTHEELKHVPRKTCKTCGKRFPTNALLRRHELVHTDIKFPCSECGESFKSRDYVRVHYKLRHLNMTRQEIKAQKNKDTHATQGTQENGCNVNENSSGIITGQSNNDIVQSNKNGNNSITDEEHSMNEVFIVKTEYQSDQEE